MEPASSLETSLTTNIVQRRIPDQLAAFAFKVEDEENECLNLRLATTY